MTDRSNQEASQHTGRPAEYRLPNGHRTLDQRCFLGEIGHGCDVGDVIYNVTFIERIRRNCRIGVVRRAMGAIAPPPLRIQYLQSTKHQIESRNGN